MSQACGGQPVSKRSTEVNRNIKMACKFVKRQPGSLLHHAGDEQNGEIAA